MENPTVEDIVEDDTNSGLKTRSKASRQRSVASTSGSTVVDPNAVLVQKVSSLASNMATQHRDLMESKANFEKLAGMMTNLTEKFEELLSSHRDVRPEVLYVSESESEESEGPVEDPFHGLFGNVDPSPPDEEDQTWNSLLSATEAPSEYGPELPPDIATSVERFFLIEPTPEKIKAWKSRYLIPSNAQRLGAPKVNREVWSLLDASRRSHDQQLQHCQSLLSTSLVAQARALARIREWHQAKKDGPVLELVKTVGETLMDSVSCIGASQWLLNIRHRGDIKQAVPSLKSIPLAGSHPSEFLFGDRVQEELKTARAAQALMRPDGNRKRRPLSGAFGSYSGNFSRQAQSKRARPKPSLNFWGDSQGQRSSVSRRPPPLLKKPQ